MEPINKTNYMFSKATYVTIVLVVLALGAGWMLGRSGSKNHDTLSTDTEPSPTINSGGTDVKSLVKYTLPDGWKELRCSAAAEAVFIVPAGAGNADCEANPIAPIKISVDAANNTDCNQLQSVQNVSKHICISEFINGMKSLKAETRFNQQTSYKKDTTLHVYYINTGDDVIKVEYVYTNDNAYQTGWEQLAKSVSAKN